LARSGKKLFFEVHVNLLLSHLLVTGYANVFANILNFYLLYQVSSETY